MIRTTCYLIAFTTFFPAVAQIASGQAYSPIYAPQSSNSGTWACYDQNHNRIPYATWTFTNGVYFNSNAHYHGPTGTEPVSTTTGPGSSDANGYVTVSLNTQLVGQEEYQQASCCLYGYCAGGSFDFAVGYGDLYYNDHPGIWVKIGGSDTGGGTNHGTTAYNRYMQSVPANGLYNATNDYLAAHPEISQICTNDMALYIGGKFDICNASGLCTKNGVSVVNPWGSPHSQHDRGTAADVAGASSSSTQCTNAGGSGVIVAEFITDCVNEGASSTYSINEGNHAHCGFGAPTWPH